MSDDAVFASADFQRQSGELARAVTTGGVRYQASQTHPGLLERLAGREVRIGQFVNGEFVDVSVQ